MSTDDFETRLRVRLAELADREDDWDDPAPAARQIAAAGIAPDDDPAILTPGPPARGRRRWLPGLAVAAVLLAVVAGGGLGLRELVQNSSNSSAGSSAGFAEGGDAANAPQATAAATVPGPASGGTGGAGCSVLGQATSTGPLSTIGSIRPSGITGSRTTSGGSVAVPYQLSFAAAGGTAQLRSAQAVWLQGGQLCGSPGTAVAGVVQAVPVEPGSGLSGSATFAAVDSSGSPLPAGDYLAVIVIPYSVGGSGMSHLVSAPVTITVRS